MNAVAAVLPPPSLQAADLGKVCLVTGGAGYLGKALVRRLADSGCEVRSLDVIPHQHDLPGVTAMVGDLRHYPSLVQACEGVDTVFHTAALIKPLSLYRPRVRRLVFEVNATGTENLLRAAQGAGVKAFVHTSSFNVVLDGDAVDEDESLPYADRARDLYSLSKIAAERSVLAANGQGGLQTCALRPGGIWGSECGSLMIRSFLQELAAGKFKALVGQPDSLLDNTHLENLVDAQLLAAQALRQSPSNAAGRAYFITDDEAVNGMEWFRPLVEGLGYRFPTLWIPGTVMKAIAWLIEIAYFLGAPEPTLTVRGIRNLTESSRLRIDRARSDLGYMPRYQRANAMPQLLAAAKVFVANKSSRKAGAA